MKGKKIEELSPEDRAKVMAKIREAGGGGGGRGGRGGRGGDGGGGGGGRGGQGLDTTEADRENAKLPLAPEEDSQLEVLLRPGLLADVEITVDKIPDAISVPNQAVFEKGDRRVVFVQKAADGRFEERVVKLAKRSESVMVIADGLKAGETIALADPTAQKNKEEKASDAPKSMGDITGAGKASPPGKGK